MKRYAVIFALTCGWTSPGSAADPIEVGQSPDDNIRICDSEYCINAAWDYFQWCWFGSGLPREMRMRAADEWHYAEYGHYYYSEWDYANLPDPPEPKRVGEIISGLRNFDRLATPTSGSSTSDSGDWSRSVAYTAQFGNGVTASIPITESHEPRYPTEYRKICDPYGAGFFYIPGTDMCLKVGGWVGQGGQTYEQFKPKEPAPKLGYEYNSEWSIGASVNYNISNSLKLGVDYSQPGTNATSNTPPKDNGARQYNSSAYATGSSGPGPVEYVRICSLYGDSFYYVPGTDTCLKISGNLAYQEWSPLRNRMRTTLGDDWTNKPVTPTAQPQAEPVKSAAQDNVKTSVDQPTVAPADVVNSRTPSSAGTKGPSSTQAKKTKGDPKQQAKGDAKQPPMQVKPELSTTPRWVDAKTGEPAQVGPDGTRTGLFDANEAFDPENGNSYTRQNGVWKNNKTGETVPELPIHAKANKDDPNTATHLYNGRQFRLEGAKPAAPAAPTPPYNNGQWVDVKTGQPVQVGPNGARPGLFDQNEAFNPHTGKSYTKENGVWKDRATGKEVPEIPINSEQDPNDPNKAKHAFNERTFVNVSPKTQADERADRLKTKLEEARAKLKTAEASRDRDEMTIQGGRIKELEQGLDPEEESAKAKARREHARQVERDLEDVQLPAAEWSVLKLKEDPDREMAKLDQMKKDHAPAADIAKQEQKLREAVQPYYDARKKLWTVQGDLKAVKEQIEKYGELRPQEYKESQLQQVKEYFEKRDGTAEQKAIESQFGKIPDGPSGQKSAERKTPSTGSKGPSKSKDAPKQAEKPAEQPVEPSDQKTIKISVEVSGWNYDKPSQGLSQDVMVNLQPGYTPSLELGTKNDVGFDEPAALVSVINGRGTYLLDYDRRQQFGLSWAKPGSTFLMGLTTPKLSEFIMTAAANQAGIPSMIPVNALPEGTSMFMETANIDGTRYVRIGAQERFDMAQQWLTGLAIAKMFNIDPAALFDDWCWQKLPAYELDPPSSTARGEGLPHATIKLSDAGRSGAR